MTITVDLRPEVEAELTRQAAARGFAVDAYAAALLEGTIHLPSETLTNPEKGKRRGRSRLVEVCAMVRGLTDDVDFSRDPATDRPVEL